MNDDDFGGCMDCDSPYHFRCPTRPRAYQAVRAVRILRAEVAHNPLAGLEPDPRTDQVIAHAAQILRGRA